MKAVVFLPTQICALIYVMLNWKIFLQYVFVFGGLRPVILYSLQELEWKLCFPIYRATWPCCLHKAYLQYLGGFGFSFCFVVQMPSLKKRSALCMLPNRKACSLPGPLQRDPQNVVMWKNKCLRLGLHGLSAEIPAVGVPVAISRAAALGGHAVGVLGAVRGLLGAGRRRVRDVAWRSNKKDPTAFLCNLQPPGSGAAPAAVPQSQALSVAARPSPR